MKKFLFLCFSVLFTNFLFAQGGTVEISGSPTVEVGVANTYTLKFTPTSPSTSTTTYTLDFWSIVAPIGGSTIQGNINNQSSPNYFYNQTSTITVSVSNTSTISIPITFGDQATSNSQISVYCSGFYRDGISTITGNISSITKLFDVRVYKINTPTISVPKVLSCCTNNVQFCASDYADANQFSWTISGGSIASGQGSNCITVTPSAGSGAVSASCTVSRSTGLSSYTRSNSVTVNRTARTITQTTSPIQNFICKGSSLLFQVDDQCGMNSLNFVAPNCTISPVTLVNGKRQATITPNNSVVVGANIQIYAIANFTGGCSAQSPSTSYVIYDSTAPPIPQGGVDIIPLSENPCTDSGYNAVFVPSVPFVNGTISISPSYFPPGRPSRLVTITVRYLNKCSGVYTSKSFTQYSPSFDPCVGKIAQNISSNSNLVIAPNPTKGNIIVTLPETLSGNYQVFDQTNSTLVQEAKFDNQSELQIDLSQKLRNGIYVLKVITENNTFTEKIILNK